MYLFKNYFLAEIDACIVAPFHSYSKTENKLRSLLLHKLLWMPLFPACQPTDIQSFSGYRSSPASAWAWPSTAVPATAHQGSLSLGTVAAGVPLHPEVSSCYCSERVRTRAGGGRQAAPLGWWKCRLCLHQILSFSWFPDMIFPFKQTFVTLFAAGTGAEKLQARSLNNHPPPLSLYCSKYVLECFFVIQMKLHPLNSQTTHIKKTKMMPVTHHPCPQNMPTQLEECRSFLTHS